MPSDSHLGAGCKVAQSHPHPPGLCHSISRWAQHSQDTRLSPWFLPLEHSLSVGSLFVEKLESWPQAHQDLMRLGQRPQGLPDPRESCPGEGLFWVGWPQREDFCGWKTRAVTRKHSPSQHPASAACIISPRPSRENAKHAPPAARSWL